MRTVFFFVLLFFLGSLSYVVWHLCRIVPGGWVPKLLAALLFVVWMVTAFAGFWLPDKTPVPVTSALSEVGYPWMIAFLYLLLAFLLADVLVLLKLIPRGSLSGNWIALAGILGVVAVALVAGGVHYKHKYRVEMDLQTRKALPRPLTMVLASDLHLGYGNRKDELARWVDLINAEEPDLVLFGGDVVDMQVRPLLEGNYAEELRRIKAPVYSVLGNHEYIGRESEAEIFFAEAGITLLRDSVARFEGIEIIGRDDRSNPGRKSISELSGPTESFTILLDHQPYHLEEAQEAGIDFQFSGHTHRGQVWPLSWLTDAMYEKSWGRHRRGSTDYYVSSGLGIWGPKIRLGTRSEYLVLRISGAM